MRWDFRQEFFSFEQYVDQRSLRLHILAVKKVITGLYLWSFVYLLCRVFVSISLPPNKKLQNKKCTFRKSCVGNNLYVYIFEWREDVTV